MRYLAPCLLLYSLSSPSLAFLLPTGAIRCYHRTPVTSLITSRMSSSSNTVELEEIEATADHPDNGEVKDEAFFQLNLAKQANAVISYKKKDMEENQKCSHCFLSMTYCICPQVSQIFNEHVPSDNKIASKCNFYIYMHYKEWGRASNTGKILSIALPKRSKIKIYGIPSDHEELVNVLSTTPSMILYPSANSKSISDCKDWIEENGGNVNLCVIDSTWPQSFAMEKSLPSHIPRVRIDEMISGPSKFLNRKQSTNKNKVSTIEAVIMAMEAMGLSEYDLQPFEKSFEYGVDAVLRQNGKRTAYGNAIIPQINREDGAALKGPYSAPMTAKPSLCLRCGISGPAINFKNLGIRRRRNEAKRAFNEEPAPNHKPFTSVKPEYLEKINDIMAKNVYRIWRCPVCTEYFPGEEDIDPNLPESLESLPNHHK